MILVPPALVADRLRSSLFWWRIVLAIPLATYVAMILACWTVPLASFASEGAAVLPKLFYAVLASPFTALVALLVAVRALVVGVPLSLVAAATLQLPASKWAFIGVGAIVGLTLTFVLYALPERANPAFLELLTFFLPAGVAAGAGYARVFWWLALARPLEPRSATVD